jgi:ABC-type branched-subunit amino acid transport system ATPase component
VAAAHVSAPLLQIQAVTRRFGGYLALDNVDMSVVPGAIHAVIGPNGAGKSTLFNVVSGVLKPTSGTTSFETKTYTGRRPDQIVGLGIARNFQQVRLFGGLSALENVMLGAHAGVARGDGADKTNSMRGVATEALAFVGFADKILAPPADFTLVQQRRLEIARALASRPKLLLLDEPAAGMNPTEVNELADLIRKMRGRSITVLLVEHHMRLVMSVADRITVLAAGRVIAEGAPTEIQSDPAVITAYLGTQQ